MNPLTWITEKIVGSVATQMGGMVIATTEAEAIKHQAKALQSLEQQAREYEADGNLLLANLIREKAKDLAGGNPGDETSKLQTCLGGDIAVPKIGTVEDEPTDTPPKKKRGRPKKVTTEEVASDREPN